MTVTLSTSSMTRLSDDRNHGSRSCIGRLYSLVCQRIFRAMSPVCQSDSCGAARAERSTSEPRLRTTRDPKPQSNSRCNGGERCAPTVVVDLKPLEWEVTCGRVTVQAGVSFAI